MNIYTISLFDPTPLDDPIYPRFMGIAKAANELGHDVTHFTSTFRHIKKEHRFEKSSIHKINENYSIVFTRSMGYSKNISAKRFLAHRDYAKKLVKELDGFSKPDIIFMSMPPLATISKVTEWASRNNVPIVIDVIDPWPDSFIKDVPRYLKKAAKLVFYSYYRMLKNAFSRASAISAISNDYLTWASNFHSPDKKTNSFFLAIDFEDIQNRIQHFRKAKTNNPSGKLSLIYAGSLASSYDIPSIVEAAKILEQKYPGKTEFIITGKGPQEKIIREGQKSTSNIHYLGWVSRDELFKQYAHADLGLIQHKNSLTQTVTYKFFNYMSAGLPLLNSLQSEMATMIDDYNLGFNNPEQDVAKLVHNIEQYLHKPELLKKHQNNVLSFTAEHGDGKVVYNKLVHFLEEVAENHK